MRKRRDRYAGHERTARLPRGDHPDPHQRQVEGADPAGSAPRYQTVWGIAAVQLREMEASGLLIRTAYPEVPPRVEYTLTELGYSLKPILDAMQTWGEDYQSKSAG